MRGGKEESASGDEGRRSCFVNAFERDKEKKKRKRALAHPKVFGADPPSRRLVSLSAPQAPRGDRGGPAGLVRRGGGRAETSAKGRVGSKMRMPLSLLSLFAFRKREQGEKKKSERSASTASEAWATRKHNKSEAPKKKEQRERKRAPSSTKFFLFPPPICHARMKTSALSSRSAVSA